jgi:hypothetical protein
MKNGQQKTVLLAEAGSMIVLLAVSITTLMLMIGLAIDAGNIYRARLALQNAADASAMGALNYCSSIGHTDMLRRVGAEGEADENVVAQRFTAHLAPHIARLARLNLGATAQGVEILRAEYLPAGDPEVSSGAAFAIAVSLQQDVDLMLLDLLPQAAFSSQRLVARAVTERRIANVALLIDVSGSMQCPAIGSCDCLPSQGGAGCPAGNTKFDLLLDAVKSFIRMFDDDHDRIVLAPFDLQAQSLALRDFATQLGVESDASTTVIDALVDAIRNEYVPSGSTNICDAFIEAAADLDVLAGDETKSFVLFTEGAPTAGRFFFTDAAAKAALDPFDVGFGRYDYTHYTIDWKQSQLDAATGRPKVFQGPSLLVNSLALTGNSIEELSMPMTNPAAPPRRSTEARCNDDLSAAGAVVSQSDVATVSERVFSPCLSSLEAHAPGNPEVKYGGNYAAGPEQHKRISRLARSLLSLRYSVRRRAAVKEGHCLYGWTWRARRNSSG